MYDVLHEIHSHLAEPMTVTDMAAKFGYSPWYFCERFRRLTGLSFGEYVRRYRIRMAALDLLDGCKTTEILSKYGYDTQGGFNKAFLKEYGCLPREYKKRDRSAQRAYEERREHMLHLTDRCAILRENAVTKKPLNDYILPHVNL